MSQAQTQTRPTPHGAKAIRSRAVGKLQSHTSRSAAPVPAAPAAQAVVVAYNPILALQPLSLGIHGLPFPSWPSHRAQHWIGFLTKIRRPYITEAALATESKTTFRPLAYKWALHLASALEFVYTQDIILGDLSTAHCWLYGTGGRALSLSLVGFLDASFRDRYSGIKYLGGASSSEPFHPLNIRQPGVRRSPEPSMQTDLFLWGCVVYQLMVGHWPGHEGGAGRSWADMDQMIPRQEWPELERDYLGQVVRRCWTGEVESSRRLRENLLEFLQTEGWQVEADDDLQFDPSPLFPELALR
ncbi:hypothetical protein F5883DRAFT_539605 [Diaporthe sp. PMI_573]|nr:hypothetical protein F5883DRAFT_539605 [Diaporthaceae sp. PMI_573]